MWPEDNTAAITPWKLAWLSRILGVGLWTWVHLLPRSLAFPNKAPFFSNDACLLIYWLWSGELKNLCLVTPLTFPSPTPLPPDSSLVKVFWVSLFLTGHCRTKIIVYISCQRKTFREVRLLEVTQNELITFVEDCFFCDNFIMPLRCVYYNVCSVAQSCLTLRPHGLLPTRIPCP